MTAWPPHSFSINSSAPHQVSLSFTGGRSGPEIAAFWEHCFKQEEWQDHPAKFLEYIQRDRILFALRFLYIYLSQEVIIEKLLLYELFFTCPKKLIPLQSLRTDTNSVPCRRRRILYQLRVLCLVSGISICYRGG